MLPISFLYHDSSGYTEIKASITSAEDRNEENQQKKVLMRSEAFTSVTIYSTSLLAFTPYSLVAYILSGGLFLNALSSKTDLALNGSVMMKDVL
jgi:hypothetical protein